MSTHLAINISYHHSTIAAIHSLANSGAGRGLLPERVISAHFVNVAQGNGPC